MHLRLADGPEPHSLVCIGLLLSSGVWHPSCMDAHIERTGQARWQLESDAGTATKYSLLRDTGCFNHFICTLNPTQTITEDNLNPLVSASAA